MVAAGIWRGCNFSEVMMEEKERAILVGTYAPRKKRQEVTPAIEDTLAELKELALSAGAEVVDTFACRLDRINPKTFIQQGKVEEITVAVQAHQADFVVFDDELRPSQTRHLEDAFQVRTLDRRALILDIFAKRAHSREGQLQVELAQLIYFLPRLTRLWTHLERQRGGIGTSGPGEKQLELDKRAIRERMRRLKLELEHVRDNRRLQRNQRKKRSITQMALVGYTNSGKSTLFNRLTEAHVLSSNQLFSTLDPTTRRMNLPSHGEVLLTDSVGFIHKLPHELVEAFKATLEEVQNADVLLHVVDASNPLWETHKRATEQVLEELGCLQKPLLEIYNKIDCLKDKEFRLAQSARRVMISALQGKNLDVLTIRLAELTGNQYQRVRLLLPQGRGDLLAIAHREGKIMEEKYEEDYVHMTVELPLQRIEQWKRNGFIISDALPSA